MFRGTSHGYIEVKNKGGIRKGALGAPKTFPSYFFIFKWGVFLFLAGALTLRGSILTYS